MWCIVGNDVASPYHYRGVRGKPLRGGGWVSRNNLPVEDPNYNQLPKVKRGSILSKLRRRGSKDEKGGSNIVSADTLHHIFLIYLIITEILLF